MRIAKQSLTEAGKSPRGGAEQRREAIAKQSLTEAGMSPRGGAEQRREAIEN